MFFTYASEIITLGGFFLSTFGQRLKDLRRVAHLTQAGLAKYLGMTRENISLYEHDKNKSIPDPVIKKLSNLFNLPPAYLRGEKDINIADLAKLVPNEILESSEFRDGEWQVKKSLNGHKINAKSSEEKPKEIDLKATIADGETIMSWDGRPIPPEELEMVRRILDGGK